MHRKKKRYGENQWVERFRIKNMYSYRNKNFNFELDLPDGWSITSGFSRIPFILANLIMRANVLEEFSNNAHENINIVVEVLRPEIPPDICELIFSIQALKMGYTGVDFSRITVGGREHACAYYVMNQKAWLKKYLIVLNGLGYAITASCPLGRKSPAVEETWDKVAVSLRLLNPHDPSVSDLNNSFQGRRTIEMLRENLLIELAKRKRG